MARNYQLSKIAKKYLKKAQNKKEEKEEKEEVRNSQIPNNTSKKENVPTKDNPLTKRPKKENKKPEVDHKQLHKKLGWFIPLEKINKILRRNPLCIIP